MNREADGYDYVELCEATQPTAVFHHYAYGNPLPFFARYVGKSGEAVPREDAVVVYARCEREAGHGGRHLARGTGGWQ